jgi:hypothetical protein
MLDLDFDEDLYWYGSRVTLLSTQGSGDYPVVVETLEGSIKRFSRKGASKDSIDEPLANGSTRYYLVDLERFPDGVYFPTLYKSDFKSLEAAFKYASSLSNTHVLVISKIGGELNSELVGIPKPKVQNDTPEPAPETSLAIPGGDKTGLGTADQGSGGTDSTSAGEN